MIMMGSQNQFANIVHLIIGPETELIMDVHGSIIMDMSPILKLLPSMDKVLVNVSKCRTEPLTDQMMTSMGIPHMCTSMNVKPVGPDGTPAQPQTTKSEVVTTTCVKCGQATTLPVPNVRLCTPCIQIELGLKHEAKNEPKGTV